MPKRPEYYCPNTLCDHHHRHKGSPKFYKRIGHFITRWNHQPVPRYRCKSCGRSFSSHTFRATYRQTKPFLNKPIFHGYCSGTTQRRLARNLGCNPKTVARKVAFLAARARLQILRQQPTTQLEEIQFDEMESFEHTRLKPLTIALAVSGDGSRIIDAQVAPITYKGRLAGVALRKYGPRPDRGKEARTKVLKHSLTLVSAARTVRIVTDAKTSYHAEIKCVFGNQCLEHVRVENRKNLLTHAAHSALRKNIQDRMFWLNHTAARIRHDLSRMMRRVWTTTKKAWALQDHLDLYIAYYNEFELPL